MQIRDVLVRITIDQSAVIRLLASRQYSSCWIANVYLFGTLSNTALPMSVSTWVSVDAVVVDCTP